MFAVIIYFLNLMFLFDYNNNLYKKILLMNDTIKHS